MEEWEAYKVGSREGHWERSPLTKISHVAHFVHARRIIEDSEIRAQLIFDESRLNDSRVRVVWLSPNDWAGAGGSRYGNVRFKFPWEEIISDARFYWVEVITRYSPHAPRILVTQRKHDLPIYDPATCEGPWQLIDGKHYWNGECTLEILLERDLPLTHCSEIDFVLHHDKRCGINPKICPDRGVSRSEAARRFCAWLAAHRKKGIPPATPDGSRATSLLTPSAIDEGWSRIYSKVLNKYAVLTSLGSAGSKAGALARACLEAIAAENDAELSALLQFFATQEDAVASVKSQLLKTFPHAATEIENAD